MGESVTVISVCIQREIFVVLIHMKIFSIIFCVCSIASAAEKFEGKHFRGEGDVEYFGGGDL